MGRVRADVAWGHGIDPVAWLDWLVGTLEVSGSRWINTNLK
jgi:hypothetical protein